MFVQRAGDGNHTRVIGATEQTGLRVTVVSKRLGLWYLPLLGLSIPCSATRLPSSPPPPPFSLSPTLHNKLKATEYQFTQSSGPSLQISPPTPVSLPHSCPWSGKRTLPFCCSRITGSGLGLVYLCSRFPLLSYFSPAANSKLPSL